MMIPSHAVGDTQSTKRGPDQAGARAGLTLARPVCEAMDGSGLREGRGGMNFKWFGPLALLAALVIGDQIRINRPGHKYRLAIEVETPDGVKSASGVVAVHPDRSYSRGGHTRTAGDAVYVDLGGGKNLVALLAHVDRGRSISTASTMWRCAPIPRPPVCASRSIR